MNISPLTTTLDRKEPGEALIAHARKQAEFVVNNLDSLRGLWRLLACPDPGAHEAVQPAPPAKALRLLLDRIRQRAVLASDDYSDDDHQYAEIPLADFLEIMDDEARRYLAATEETP